MYKAFNIGNFHSDGEVIGSGSFADVVSGHNIETNEQVAIKIIKPGFQSQGPEHRKQLQTEIDILTNMNHNNIVKCYGIFHHPDSKSLCIVMEYCNGGNLRDYMKLKGGYLTEYVAQNIMRQLANGLSYLKKNNIIHRDLKPDNLLIKYIYTADNRKTFVLKISDFGLSVILSDDDDLAKTQCGSRLYMAPEIHMRKKYTYKADLWSVGSILFLLLTGKPLFTRLPPIECFMPNRTLYSQTLIESKLNLCSNTLDMLLQLLQNNPQNRIEWDNFISHPFITGHGILPAPKSDRIDTEMDQLKLFSINSSLAMDSSSMLDESLKFDLIDTSANDMQQLIYNLQHQCNIIHTVLHFADNYQKLQRYGEAINIYTKVLLAIKDIIKEQKPNKNNKAVYRLVKELYNTLTKYLDIRTECVKNHPASTIKLPDIILQYVQNKQKKIELNEMLGNITKCIKTADKCLLCLEFVRLYVNEFNADINKYITIYNEKIIQLRLI